MIKRRKNRYTSNKIRKLIKIGILIAVVIIFIIVISISSNMSKSGPNLSKVKKKGTLLVAVDENKRGFSDGERGLEIELAKLISKKIFSNESNSDGRVIPVKMNSSFIDSHFSDSSIDMAIMLSPNGLYSKKYVYSEPYYTDKCLVVINKRSDNAASLKNKRIGVIVDSIGKKRLQNYLESNNITATIVEYPTYEIMLNDLSSGAVYAAILPKVEYREYSNEYDTQLHSQKLPDVGYSVMCNPEDSDLITVINSVINELKKTGELDALIKKYIGE